MYVHYLLSPTLQVFVNFAKEQSDDDLLREVTVNGGTPAPQPRRAAQPTQPGQTAKAAQTTKPPQSVKSSDGRPRETKPNGVTDSGMAMTSRLQEKPQSSRGESRRELSSRRSSKESSANGSKGTRETSGNKDPTSLFLVGSSTQDSSV